MNTRPTVIVYRDDLLPYSETFILSQARGLQAFRPVLAGIRRVNGLDLSGTNTVVLNGGGIWGHVRGASFGYCRMVGRMRRILREFSPVLIHAHFGPDGCNAMPMARTLQVPLIVTFHGYDATTRDEEMKRKGLAPYLYTLRKKALQQGCDLFICVSEFIRRKLLALGFPSEKLLVHYIGVDVDFFAPDSRILRTPTVLFVGRLVEKKGCSYLIRAMQMVQTKMPKAEVVIIGDGELRAELETEAATRLKNYRFLGPQPSNVVREWMNRAAIFSTPSVIADCGDAEGFGMVFAEAQAMGLPVATFASGGIPEAISHGETGFLAPERNWEQLASHILTLLTDQDTWDKFSHAGRRRVCKLFNVSKQTAILEDIYSKVLERHSLAKAAKEVKRLDHASSS